MGPKLLTPNGFECEGPCTNRHNNHESLAPRCKIKNPESDSTGIGMDYCTSCEDTGCPDATSAPRMKGQAIRLGISNGRRRQKKKKNKGNTNSNNLFPLRLALFCFPGTISFLQIKFHNPYRFVTLPFLTSFKISLFLFLAFPSLLLFTISCSLCSLVSSSATSVSTIS